MYIKDNLNLAYSLLLILAAVAMPDMVYAASVLGNDMCNFINQTLLGSTGAAIATMGIMVIGIGALLGRVSWGMAVMIAAGIAAIFGAPTIIQTFTGSQACPGGGVDA